MASVNLPEEIAPGSPGPAPQLNPQSSLESFGGGESLDKVFQGAGNLTQVSKDLLETQKKNMDEMVMGQADLDLAKAKNSAMAQAMQNNRGMNADKALDEAKKIYDKQVSSIYQGMGNPQQQEQMQLLAQKHAADLVTTLTNFRTQQFQEWDKNTTESRVKGYADEGIQSGGNPKEIKAQSDQINAVWQDYGRRMGMDPAEIRQHQLDSLSIMHGGVVSNFLAQGAYKPAQAYFDEHKADISPSRLPGLQNELRQGAIVDVTVGLWKQMGTVFSMPDGSPDIDKINKTVMSLPDPEEGKPGFTDAEKLKVAENMKGLAYEQQRSVTIQKAQDNEAFNKQLDDWKKQGKTLADVMPSINGSGGDTEAKLEMAKRKFATEDKGDSATFNGLMNGIMDGKTQTQDIENAFMAKGLSVAEKGQLYTKLASAIKDGISPEEKVALPQVKALARDYYGLTPSEAEGNSDYQDFMKYMYTKSGGKMSTDIVDFAQKELASQHKEGTMFGKMDKWKADLAQEQHTESTFAPIRQYLTPDLISAVGHGSVTGTKKSWNAGDVNEFARQLGGYEAIKPGTPANNAMLSLVKAGKPVTVPMVKWVLTKSPDGNY